MSIELIVEIFAEMFRTVLYVAGPALLVSLSVGLLVGFFQTITSIQEFTLTFVPKMLCVFGSLFLMMPWLAEKLLTFTSNLITEIPNYIK